MEFGGEDGDVVRIRNDCDVDFEIVPGKDAIEQLVGVAIIASPENASILSDPRQPDVSEHGHLDEGLS